MVYLIESVPQNYIIGKIKNQKTDKILTIYRFFCCIIIQHIIYIVKLFNKLFI